MLQSDMARRMEPAFLITAPALLRSLRAIRKITAPYPMSPIIHPEKKGKKMFEVRVDQDICRGDTCGCSRLCTRIFRCPGLVWDHERHAAVIDEVICAGCGVCAEICPAGAIRKTEAGR